MSRQPIGPNQLTMPAPDPGVVALSTAFLKPTTRVLDAGCGNGRNSIHLAKDGHSVIGIDKDPVLVAEARIWVSTLGSMALHLDFQEGDMLEPHFEAARFEAVLATRCLQELRDRRQVRKALSNFQHATVPEGYNFVTAYIGSRREQASKPHLTILSPGEIENIYREQGWGITHANRTLLEPTRFLGETLVRSYDEIVTRKPSEPDYEQPQLDLTHALSLEYWRRADPEYYDYLMAACNTD